MQVSNSRIPIQEYPDPSAASQNHTISGNVTVVCAQSLMKSCFTRMIREPRKPGADSVEILISDVISCYWGSSGSSMNLT